MAHEMRCHQQEALRAISDAIVAIESGQEQHRFSLAGRRALMHVVLTRYRAFLHRRLFDPAVAARTTPAPRRGAPAEGVVQSRGGGASPTSARLARFHIAAEWHACRATARLAGSRLRRRMLDENEQLAGLIG